MTGEVGLVTFVLPSGTKVTVPQELALKLGWKPEPETAKQRKK